ncbi:hypothetical protein YTPLAS18_32790 [Nitrospira sp.]|nr:hypothetical protein YTPLAS18_32790 [Nitrospira sp.]
MSVAWTARIATMGTTTMSNTTQTLRWMASRSHQGGVAPFMVPAVRWVVDGVDGCPLEGSLGADLAMCQAGYFRIGSPYAPAFIGG